MTPRKKLCGEPVRDALWAIGLRVPKSRRIVPEDFTEEERFRMFKAVLHGQVFPAAEITGWDGRTTYVDEHSVWAWRHGGRQRFEERVRASIAEEVARADYTVYDLSPLRCLIGDDGAFFCRMLSAADAAEAEQRMNGMTADLDVIDRKLDRIKKGESFGDLRYRISLYDNAFEAVIHGRRGGWLWMRIW